MQYDRDAKANSGAGGQKPKEGEDIVTKKLLMLLLCSVILLAGCGGGTVKTGDGGDKPWQLFTEEEAEKVLGFDVEQEVSMIDSKLDQRMVYYGSASGDESDFIQVSVAKNKEADKDSEKEGSNENEPVYTVEQLFEDAKTGLADSVQPVEGFGDEAFWYVGALHILKDGYYVTVSTGNTDDPKYLERAKEVAEIIMGRL